MNKNAYRNSELAEKNSAENSVSCKQLAQDNVHTAKSSTSANNIKSTSAQNMRNFRNFHAKITPLIAVFALVAFSILAFTKLPAFAEDHAQDLNKAEVLCGDSASSEQGARDLSKTEVSRGDSAGSGQDAQNNSVITPLNKQDSSTQSVPSNEQAQSEQDSVITPLDTQTEQNQHAQDNCVQTHSAGQDLEPNSAQTHLNTQINAQVPLRVQSTTITPKASTGVNINLSDNPETTLAGTGWTYDSTTSVYTITNSANVTISGTTTNKRVVVASGATATVTLNGASITSSSGSPIILESNANLTLKLSDSNVLTSNAEGFAGLNVPSGATLTIQSASGGGTGTEGSLTANGGEYGAGIGGNDSYYEEQTVGIIIINGGTIKATGGNTGAGIGGGDSASGGNITITGGVVYAYTSGGTDDPAAIGGGAFGGTGTISITGGVVIATVGNQNSPGIGGGAGNSEGSISITGGTIISNSKIGLGNVDGKTATTISGHPIIFSTEINGYSNDPTNGVLVGGNDKYTLDISTTPITLTINENFTVPSGATFTIPAGVNVSIPSGKTLTVANGGTLDIKEGAILGVHETSQVINEEGATIIGNDKIVIKANGSDVSASTLQHVTSTSITINPATLLSETGQEVEYAISTTNELSTKADWQTGTTFEELTPNTQYYIFARSKENATHKAGAAKQLEVKTAAQVAYTNSNDTGHSTSPWWTFNSETGTLIINLENVYAATGNPSVEVVGDACGGSGWEEPSSACRLSIQHLAFTNEGNNVTQLNIGVWAFGQISRTGNTSLASVAFPDGLASMNIGYRAFRQEADSTSLASISFPDSLTTLRIGVRAFEQHAIHGNTSLASVTFPSNLSELTIYSRAFTQSASSGTIAFKYAFLPSSHLPANTTVASDAFPSEKPIYWLGATGTAFGVLPTGDEGSSPILTQLPLTELTATPEETTQTVAVNTPLSFTNVQAVYGGGENQPTFGPVELAPETSSAHEVSLSADDVDFTKYKIISTVSGRPDTNATVNDNSITFTSTGERTVTLSVPGFGEDVVKAYAVNVNPANPSASNTSSIGTAITGVPANALGLIMLMMLLVGAGFVRARRKMV